MKPESCHKCPRQNDCLDLRIIINLKNALMSRLIYLVDNIYKQCEIKNHIGDMERK